jgi:type IV secretion system protein VirB8
MSAPDPGRARDAYYREAASWNEDRLAWTHRSRRVAWIVAAAATAVALAEAIALVVLLPLKTVVPYTLMVDRQTGFVQALQPLSPERIAPDRALTQSFLVQYVIARESFDVTALQDNYRKVAQWSGGSARAGYIASVQASNPDSPLARLPRSTVVETRVKSVSPLGGNAALVRFDTQRRDANGQAAPAQPWVAVIAYRFTGEPLKLEDRFVNPLGFQVTRYGRNAEALPRSEPPPPAATAPAGASTGAAPSPLAGVVRAAPATVPVVPAPPR